MTAALARLTSPLGSHPAIDAMPTMLKTMTAIAAITIIG
jgi:hypothetical protein